jgi:hypothetical protein
MGSPDDAVEQLLAEGALMWAERECDNDGTILHLESMLMVARRTDLPSIQEDAAHVRSATFVVDTTQHITSVLTYLPLLTLYALSIVHRELAALLTPSMQQEREAWAEQHAVEHAGAADEEPPREWWRALFEVGSDSEEEGRSSPSWTSSFCRRTFLTEGEDSDHAPDTPEDYQSLEDCPAPTVERFAAGLEQAEAGALSSACRHTHSALAGTLAVDKQLARDAALDAICPRRGA